MRNAQLLTFALFGVFLQSVSGFSGQLPTPNSSRQPAARPNKEAEKNSNNLNIQRMKPSTPLLASRSSFLSTMANAAGISLIFFSQATKSSAFEGGVGGLGKTKPETGVVLFNEEYAPVQNAAGIISAELSINNQPVLLTFQTPWPLLASQGVEARDLQGAESAFVQVVSKNIPKELPLSKQAVKKLLIDSVFSQQGKFGAYAAPTDVKVKATADPAVFAVSFTTFTPGLRESDRQVLVKCCPVGGSLVLLITGTTALRYKKQEAVLQKVVDSFAAVAAPSSRLR